MKILEINNCRKQFDGVEVHCIENFAAPIPGAVRPMSADNIF